MAPALTITPYGIARRYVGLEELGRTDHPFIQWCFTLCGYGPDTPDEVAWCSAFMQHPPYELGLPRSKSAAARSWLKVGEAIDVGGARPGFDLVVLNRGNGPQDPTVFAAPGHVGWFHSVEVDHVFLLGGNQSNAVTIARFPRAKILGVRRLG